MRDRLIELFMDSEAFNGADGRADAKHIADHLLENGVIVPPCKVGDTVYIVCGDDYYDENLYVEEHKITGMTFSNEHECYFFMNECLGQYLEPFEECDIGKTVFLTREEAERVLKGGGEE